MCGFVLLVFGGLERREMGGVQASAVMNLPASEVVKEPFKMKVCGC